MADRIAAHNIGEAVVITVDATTARDLAQAWGAAHAGCDELEADRPRWHEDVVVLMRAAGLADQAAGRVADPVMVPLWKPRPHLTLVDGGASA